MKDTSCNPEKLGIYTMITEEQGNLIFTFVFYKNNTGSDVKNGSGGGGTGSKTSRNLEQD